MRKSVICINLLFGFLVAISMVSALYNCQSSQTIMKLSSLSNAHVGSSTSAFSINVCYDEIFGVNYTGASPQSCTGSNQVAKISQNTNAHIEGPVGTAFSINVCYGDLICTLRSGVCQSNESQIVSLAQTTNSHASITNTFTYKICCRSAFALASLNSTNLSTGTGLISFTINSPISGTTYNNSVLLSITSQNASAILYNFGTGNFSYISPINLAPANGSYILNVYVLNATTMLQQTISFGILNTSLPANTTNMTNTTNTTIGTGLMSFTINSPTSGTTYNNSVLLSITSQNASAILYNFGTGNFSYTIPTTISFGNGSYVLNVYALNATTMLQQSLAFAVTNSSLPANTTNMTNTTNTTTGTGLMSFTINSPISGTTYNASVPINITFSNSTSVQYNFGTGNFSYISPINLSLTNGSYIVTIYVSNATTMLQQSIFFNIINSTTNSNPTNTTNSTNGNNGGNGGGSNDDSSSSGGGVKSGTTIANQRTQQEISGDEPILLVNQPVAKKSTIGATLLKSGLILLILIAFIIVAQLLINRHFQSRNKRV